MIEIDGHGRSQGDARGRVAELFPYLLKSVTKEIVYDARETVFQVNLKRAGGVSLQFTHEATRYGSNSQK